MKKHCGRLAPFVCIVLTAASLMGCPFDVRQALIVEPLSLDFGTTITVLQFDVRAAYSSRPVEPITATPSANWMSVLPASGSSSGPDEIVRFTVTANRGVIPAGEFDGTIVVESPGLVPIIIDTHIEKLP